MSKNGLRARRRTIVRGERLGVRYARYSDEQQASIVEQQSINADTADDAGVDVVESFSDAAVSRSINDRPDLLRMFAYLEEHPEVGFIIVNELERLTAGIAQRAIVVEMCQRLQITILTEDIGEIGPFDEDKMQEADKRSVDAKGEVIKIRRRVRRSLKSKVKDGDIVQMRPCFGIRSKPVIGPDGQPVPAGMKLLDEKGRKISSGKIEIEEKEIGYLREIFRLADGGMSDSDIARYLTGRVPTKTGATIWRNNSVNGILTNPFYKGDIVWGRQEVRRDESSGKKYLVHRLEGDPGRVFKESPLGPLVPVDQWERVNARIAARVGESRINRRVHAFQTFDGLVYCHYCGHRMYGRPERAAGVTVARPYKHLTPPFRYYCDSKHKRRGADAKPGFAVPCTVPRSMTAYQIIDAFRQVTGDRLVTVRRQSLSLDTDLEGSRLKATIADSVAALGRATSLHLKNDRLMPEDKLLAMSDDHDALAARIQEQIDALVSTTRTPISALEEERLRVELRSLADVLAHPVLPSERKNALLREAGIERIYLDRPAVEVEFLGP